MFHICRIVVIPGSEVDSSLELFAHSAHYSKSDSWMRRHIKILFLMAIITFFAVQERGKAIMIRVDGPDFICATRSGSPDPDKKFL